MDKTLISWLGLADLDAVTESAQNGIGPVARAIQTGRFSRLDLLCDCASEKADAYLDWLRPRTKARIVPHPVVLPNPTDFDAIYRHARGIAEQAWVEAGRDADRLTFYLSPGTPAMAAVWIILAKTRFPAELIESSTKHGVRTVSVPFQISADFIPDLLQRPDAELIRLTAGLPPAAPAFKHIIHESQVMQRVVARARRVALRSIPVLIEGESGTGKELLARAIHQASPRRDCPWIAVNCGAIPPELIDSVLFGHEKGAFTGASSTQQGLFEAADKGTLFLDEIGELPKWAQVRFLRALQEGEITRVGATGSVRVDVRLIAATNRSLTREVSEGRFREDLFYRLAVAVINLPPLRDRDGDDELLLQHLLAQVNQESATEPGYEPKKLSVTASKLLLDHLWPGNVREMLNTLRRAAVWTPGPIIDVDDARDALLPPPERAATEDSILAHDVRRGIHLKDILDQVTHHYLTQAMEISGGNMTQAAKLIGVSNRPTFTNLLKKHGIER